MASFGGDFERLSVLSRLSNSSEEVDDSDDSLEVLYTGMDTGELDEVSSCNNLSGSDVSNDSGRENENEIESFSTRDFYQLCFSPSISHICG